jgi:UMF1 family MFS transporter
MFADLTPKHYEASFFSIFAITDKGSSWIGPIVCGAIMNTKTVPNHVIFIYLTLGALIPMLCIHFFVDHKQGMIDSGRLLLESRSKGDVSPAATSAKKEGEDPYLE